MKYKEVTVKLSWPSEYEKVIRMLLYNLQTRLFVFSVTYLYTGVAENIMKTIVKNTLFKSPVEELIWHQVLVILRIKKPGGVWMSYLK